MRRYETIFILRPNVGEEEINRVVESTTQIVLDEAGSIIELNKWGMKKLAYLIKKESLGYYVFCDYAGTPAAVAEIERKFRIDDTVLKYMTIKTGASITEEEIQLAVAAVSERQAAAIESEQEEAATSEEEVKKEVKVEAKAEVKVEAKAEATEDVKEEVPEKTEEDSE